MKIEIIGKAVILTSGNSVEANKLVQTYLNDGSPADVVKTDMRGRYKRTKSIKRNSWKGKHSKQCDVCGKTYKSVVLHKKFAHEGVLTGYAAARAKAAKEGKEGWMDNLEE